MLTRPGGRAAASAICGAFLAFFGSVDEAAACSTPVFRYAMKFWAQDNYGLTVVHKGPLSSAEQALVNRMSGWKAEMKGLNLEVGTVDTTGSVDPKYDDVLKNVGAVTAPVAVLTGPSHKGLGPVVWKGPLDARLLEILPDSPVRRDISRQLVAGDLAVWVVVDAGDKKQTDQAVQALADILRDVQKRLIETKQKTDVPFVFKKETFSFSLVPIANTNAEEEILLAAMRHVDPEVDPASPMETLFYPVFGRGRVLKPLRASQVKKEPVTALCEFLSGDCSCEVKALNPGMDLLMAGDWETAAKRIPDPPPPPEPKLTTMPPGGTNAGETTSATGMVTAASEAISADVLDLAARRHRSRILLVGLMVAVGVLFGGSVIWYVTGRKEE